MARQSTSRLVETTPQGDAEIIVTVHGGVVQDVTGVPHGVRVKVIDYDVETDEPDECDRDDAGAPCCISVWESEG